MLNFLYLFNVFKKCLETFHEIHLNHRSIFCFHIFSLSYYFDLRLPEISSLDECCASIKLYFYFTSKDVIIFFFEFYVYSSAQMRMGFKTQSSLSIDEFFGENIVNNIASFLGIDKSRIRVMNIVSADNTARRKRRRRAFENDLNYIEVGISKTSLVNEISRWQFEKIIRMVGGGMNSLLIDGTNVSCVDQLNHHKCHLKFDSMKILINLKEYNVF